MAFNRNGVYLKRYMPFFAAGEKRNPGFLMIFLREDVIIKIAAIIKNKGEVYYETGYDRNS